MNNQDTMQATYHVEEPIEILFYQIKTVQDSVIAGNSTFTNLQLANMVIAQILTTQEYMLPGVKSMNTDPSVCPSSAPNNRIK